MKKIGDEENMKDVITQRSIKISNIYMTGRRAKEWRIMNRITLLGRTEVHLIQHSNNSQTDALGSFQTRQEDESLCLLFIPII